MNGGGASQTVDKGRNVFHMCEQKQKTVLSRLESEYMCEVMQL